MRTLFFAVLILGIFRTPLNSSTLSVSLAALSRHLPKVRLLAFTRLYWCRGAALLCKTSRRPPAGGRVTWQGLMRGTPLDHRLEVELPSWHSKGGGFSGTALGHRPQNRAKGTDPRTGTLKRETCFCPGVLSSLCPGLPCRGFPGSRSLVLRSCPGGFLFVLCPASCFFPLAAGVTFQLPAGGTSGQVSFLFGRRPKNRSRGERKSCLRLGDKTLPSFR